MKTYKRKQINITKTSKHNIKQPNITNATKH
jgi:hypothetical protein